MAFGAALGIVAGRILTMVSDHRLVLTPMTTADSGGVALTWIGKK
jgi:hypothetical protein